MLDTILNFLNLALFLAIVAMPFVLPLFCLVPRDSREH